MSETNGRRSMREMAATPWGMILLVMLSGSGGTFLGQRVLGSDQAQAAPGTYVSTAEFAGAQKTLEVKLEGIADSQTVLLRKVESLDDRIWGMQGQGGGRNSRSYSPPARPEWPPERDGEESP